MKQGYESVLEELCKIRLIQDRCDHEWGELVFEPETKEIMAPKYDNFYGLEVMYYSMPTGKFETIDRWSRTCPKCNKKEYIYEKEKVIIKTDDNK